MADRVVMTNKTTGAVTSFPARAQKTWEKRGWVAVRDEPGAATKAQLQAAAEKQHVDVAPGATKDAIVEHLEEA